MNKKFEKGSVIMSFISRETLINKPFPKIFLGAALWLFIIFSAPLVLAHGVIWKASERPPYAFTFEFADGTIMANMDVIVYAPSKRHEPKIIYQTGKTDPTGTFAFVPTKVGRWTVTTTDNAGHLAVAYLTLKEEDFTGGEAPSVKAAAEAINVDRAIEAAAKPLKMGLVVSILFNIALVAMYRKSKKMSSNA